jgi:hypothetical protein
LDLSGLESLLLAVHLGLSGLTKHPEFMLSQTEAKAMAEAAARVARHYDFVQSQRAMDWAALGMICVSTYGPRLMVIAAQHRPTTRRQSAPPSIIPAGSLNGGEPTFSDFPPAADDGIH